MVVSSVWEKPLFLKECVGHRKLARKRHPHLTFDCFKAKVDRDMAVCSAGTRIGTNLDGSMPLASVLKGRTATVCDLCLEFEGGD